MSELKEILREEALKYRERTDSGGEDPEAACGIFFEFIKPEKNRIVALYSAKGREFDPYPILEKLQESGNVCALPVVQKDSRELKFACWADGDPLEKGPYDILQPVADEKTQWVEPDIVIIPFLAFDRQGYRLGYGGGYYDVTLKALREKKDVLAVGVGYAHQICLFTLPVEDHDEPLDWVITTQEAHEFQ